jgi:predicted anti-sigma-YlaC factor YlaD
MTCFSTKRQSTAYVDGRLRAREHSRIVAHLSECDSCASYFDQVSSLRSGLRSLPAQVPPESLATRLRVIASREQQAVSQTRGSRLEYFLSKWRFRLRELMRLFSTLTFAISTTTRGVTYEVPVVYEDKTAATLVPVDFRSAIIVTMSLDDKGRIRDYAVHDGHASFAGDPSRLDSNIAMPQFPGVLTFAHPISGDIRISLTPIVFRQ